MECNFTDFTDPTDLLLLAFIELDYSPPTSRTAAAY
jgi:hypothetical protein